MGEISQKIPRKICYETPRYTIVDRLFIINTLKITQKAKIDIDHIEYCYCSVHKILYVLCMK